MANTLHLTCGLPGAGKTTLSHRIVAERGAFRICSDEWLITMLGGPIRPAADEIRQRLEPLLWTVAQQLLREGGDVVLDFGLWFRTQRDQYRLTARELGVRVELHLLDPPLEELWRRVSARNDSGDPWSFFLTRAEMELWTASYWERPTPEELALFDPAC